MSCLPSPSFIRSAMRAAPGVALAAGLYAEEAPPADPPAPAGDRVAVAAERERDFAPGPIQVGKLGLSNQDSPQSVTVLPADLLQSAGATSLRDALRLAPGVTLAAGEGGRTGDSLSIRGFAANSDTYLDGLKDNGQYARDTFFIEQVEVVKGPSAVLFGRGATGGAVNLVSRRPGERWQGSAAVTVGTNQLQRYQVGAGGPVAGSGVGVRLDAFWQDAGSFRDRQETRSWGVAPLVEAKIGERATVWAQLLRQEQSGTMDYGLPFWYDRPADVPISQFYGFADDDFLDTVTTVWTGGIRYRLDGGWEWRDTVRVGDYERDYRSGPLGAVSRTTGVMTRSQALRENTQDTVVNQAEISYKSPKGARTVAFTGGVEVGREHYEFRSKTSTAVPTIGLFAYDPRLTWTVGTGRANDLEGALNSWNRTDTTWYGVYGHLAVEVVPTLTAVAGLRLDRFDANYVAGPVAGSKTETRLSRDDSMASPRAGLVYEPLPELSFYANYGTSFNPSAETFSLSTASALVGPEKSRSYEVGAKGELFDQALQLTAAAFRIDKTNVRQVDPFNTALQTIDGRQMVDGLEFGAAGAPTAWWSMHGGLALMTGEVVASTTTASDIYGRTVWTEGMDLTNLPSASGSLWTVFKLGFGFEIGGGIFASSRRWADAANSAYLPGYARLDAMAGWARKAGGVDWRAQLNLMNLTDAVYFNSSNSNRFTDPGAPLGGQLTLSAGF